MKLEIGDTILYKRKRRIDEYEIIKFSPSGIHVHIDNEEWELWINRAHILENLTIEDEAEPKDEPIQLKSSPRKPQRLGTWVPQR